MDVVADVWISQLVDGALAEFLQDPSVWAGGAQKLDQAALAELTTKLRARLQKSPEIINRAQNARLKYCNSAYQQVRAYENASVFAFVPDPQILALIKELVAQAPTELNPNQLQVYAPLFRDSLLLLRQLALDNGVVPGLAKQTAARGAAKQKTAKKAAQETATESVSWLQHIGMRILRYEENYAAKTPHASVVALHLFNELYGSLSGWLTANETGKALDQINASSPVEVQAFKRGFVERSGGGWIVADAFLNPPTDLRQYALDWDRTDPAKVAEWLWKQNQRALPLHLFLAAYADDAVGMRELRKLLALDGAGPATWALSGKAFDSLARARDYYSGAVYKRRLDAQACLAKLQQGAQTLQEEVADGYPRPWTLATSAKVEALIATELEKQYPHYALRIQVATLQLAQLTTVVDGTDYEKQGIIEGSSARDPWISDHLLTVFVNDRLQAWHNESFRALWDDASPDFMLAAGDNGTREIREDGTIVSATAASPFRPWKLEVFSHQGFYRYRSWDAISPNYEGDWDVEKLLQYKQDSEDTDRYLERVRRRNLDKVWGYADDVYYPLQPSAYGQFAPDSDPIGQILAGDDPSYQAADGGYIAATMLLVPRIVPYAVLNNAGSLSADVGYDSLVSGFPTKFSTGISTRARFFLGFLNNDYAVFSPSDRTSLGVLDQMYKARGQQSRDRNAAFRSGGGFYRIPWPASLSWLTLTDSPPTVADQLLAQQNPLASDYDGGLLALSERGLRGVTGEPFMGEVINPKLNAAQELERGSFTMGLLWRMTRPRGDDTSKLTPFSQRDLGGLKGAMLQMEVSRSIPNASPALRDLGKKLKSQRKLERIGLYTRLFDEAFRQFLADDEVRGKAFAEHYNATWVGYRARAYSAALEVGNPSITPSLVRWKHKKGIDLYDYQSDAVLRLDDQQGGLLAFDVGVGKTLTALAAIAYARQEGKARRILCVVPNTIQRQWLQEFNNALPDYNVVILGQTERAPTRVPRQGPDHKHFVAMAAKGNKTGNAKGGWLWLALRDYFVPQFAQATPPIEWKSTKDKEGWRGVTQEAERLATQVIVYGGTLRAEASHLAPFLTASQLDQVYPGLPLAFQKSSKAERELRWEAFAAGHYDAMICSDVDFDYLAMRDKTLKTHLQESPALRSRLIQDTFASRSAGAGSDLKRKLGSARTALRNYMEYVAGGALTPDSTKNWVLDVVFPQAGRAQAAGGAAGGAAPGWAAGGFGRPQVSIPPSLGVPKAPHQTIGAALEAYIDQGMEDLETMSGVYWEEAVNTLASKLFGAKRNRPDEAAQAAYLKLFEMPMYTVIEDSKGNLAMTVGMPEGSNWWSKNKFTLPNVSLRSPGGGGHFIPPRSLFLDEPETTNGTKLVGYQNYGTDRGGVIFPDGAASTSGDCITLLDYSKGGNTPLYARYSKMGTGWSGVPLGALSGADLAARVATKMTAEWKAGKKYAGGATFQGFNPKTQKQVTLTGPFKARSLELWNASKQQFTGTPVRLKAVKSIKDRKRRAQRYASLPRLYDTQPDWKTPPRLHFEDLQVDFIVADEAHKYKALFAPRERGGKVAYLQAGASSNRAWAMEVRSADVKSRNGRVLLLTATPAKTSPLEFYNVMQLVGAPGLGGDLSVFSQFGIYTPEQFISRFVKIEDTIIIDPDGSMRRGAAATAFINLDKEFTAIFHRYSNRKTVLDVPTLRGRRAAKGKGAVYKAGDSAIALPNAKLGDVTIGDRFQLETGNSKGGYRIQGFVGSDPAQGVMILPSPAKDSSIDAVLQGDNWSVYTDGKVPLGPPPTVVDVPLDLEQGIYYGALQKALAKMILEDRRRVVVSVGGADLLETTKLKVYPAMSRLTLHPQLELHTFEVEVLDTSEAIISDSGEEIGETKRTTSNPYAHGLALALNPMIDPVDRLVELERRGVGPWCFFGAPATNKAGKTVQSGGLSSGIKVISPAYLSRVNDFKRLARKLRDQGALLPDEEKLYDLISAQFHPDLAEGDKAAWATPTERISTIKYIGGRKRDKQGRLLKPGGVVNVLNLTLEPKATVQPNSPRLAALIDRVLSRALEDTRTAANVTCGNIAFCDNLYTHAWTVVAWCRSYAQIKLFQQWAEKHLGPRKALPGDAANDPTGPRVKGLDPNIYEWVEVMKLYGLGHLYYSAGAAMQMALPEASFTLTPAGVVANDTSPQTALVVGVLEALHAYQNQRSDNLSGEAAAYVGAAEPEAVPLFLDFEEEDADVEPLRWDFDAYYVEGANQIVVMNGKVAPSTARQDITDAFNGEYSTDAATGETTVVTPREYTLLLANEVAYEGVDLQAATCAIHHLDLPWTPSDFIQRQGRGVRQGNYFEVVDSYVYLSRNTVDYFRLQALERKRAWLESALDAESPTFELSSNEEELLQLACQSVHPDDVVAVCAKAAQKLQAIKRERMVKDFIPIKSGIRAVGVHTASAFLWHLGSAGQKVAISQYKSFLSASRTLRESDTQVLLQPTVLEPSISEQLQKAFLQGVDPEDIPASLENLLPVSVAISGAVEDPSERTPAPVLLENTFLAGVVSYPTGGALSKNPLLQIPGTQQVVFRDGVKLRYTYSEKGDYPRSTSDSRGDQHAAMPFGGLYIGKNVTGTEQGSSNDLQGAVWALKVQPNAVNEINQPTPAWVMVKLGDATLGGENNASGYAGRQWVRTGNHHRAPALRTTQRHKVLANLVGPDGLALMPDGFDPSLVVGVTGALPRSEDAEETPTEVVIPYSPGIIKQLAALKIVAPATGNPYKIFRKSLVTFVMEYAKHSYQLGGSGQHTGIPSTTDFGKVLKFPEKQRFHQNPLRWLSGCASGWIEGSWDSALADKSLELATYEYVLNHLYLPSSVQSFRNSLARMELGADIDPTDLYQAVAQLQPYEGVVRADSRGGEDSVEETRPDYITRNYLKSLHLPCVVGKQPYVATLRKLSADTELASLLLIAPFLAAYAGEYLQELDPAEEQQKLEALKTEVKTLQKAQDKAVKARDKAVGAVEDAAYLELEEAAKKVTQAAITAYEDQQTAEVIVLALAGQTVSLAQPTYAGLKAWLFQASQVQGRVSQGLKLGQLSLSDVTFAIRNWWAQLSPQVKSPVGGAVNQIFPEDSTFVTSYDADKKTVALPGTAGNVWGKVGPTGGQQRLFRAGNDDDDDDLAWIDD